MYVIVFYYFFKVYRKFRVEFGSASFWVVFFSEVIAALLIDFGGEIYIYFVFCFVVLGWFLDIGKVWCGYLGVMFKNN